MEAKLLPQNSGGITALLARRRRPVHKPGCFRVAAVLTRPTENVVTDKRNTVKEVETIAGVAQIKTIYNDSWVDRMAINHLSQSVQATTGIRNDKDGYEGMVEAAKAVSRNFNPIEQRELVTAALEKAFPRPILTMIRTMLPESKLAREFFAVFTTIFFVWLIGPCEVRESELNGRTEKNVVHIKKCRFLEESNCVGMCTNLCKVPSQTFIKDSLGVPVTMVPNFDDMSCEMIFGQEPPASYDDPAFKQPCYKLCKETRKHGVKCSS
ncbi:beta-carotene isomerase D27, chloroplastic-like [Melia azedarach]|uniref:Beta-carotene isomerase D27, chloroplastic-like n=1 Tax=Melia azedarach TaxID=155640 RepID=A0ACC1YW40_MELAZ|nr:beta-carotene isomerase D27, chloroplastic-like [Melia azedarach]